LSSGLIKPVSDAMTAGVAEMSVNNEKKCMFTIAKGTANRERHFIFRLELRSRAFAVDAVCLGNPGNRCFVVSVLSFSCFPHFWPLFQRRKKSGKSLRLRSEN
jgi:hypothetical protein